MSMSRRARELAAEGRHIVTWSAGEPDFPSPKAAVEAARRALEMGHTRYAAASGIQPLREALADRYAARYGAPWSADEVAISVGAKAALYELFQILLDEGDEVVLPSPAWVSFEAQIHQAGGRVVKVPTSVDDAFQIHAQPVIDAMTERTAAILINSPANPTGGVISSDDLRRVAAAAAERGIPLISDETYECFVFDGRQHASAAPLAAEMPETVVVVGTFSKTYAMTGWRVGYVLGPRSLIGLVGSLQSHLTSNPTTFAMYGALAALEDAEEQVAEMARAFEERRDSTIPRLNALPGIQCPSPAGAFFAFPRVADHFDARRPGSVAFCEWLLEEVGVALVPGLSFGADEHVRISFASSPEDLDEGLSRLEALLTGEPPPRPRPPEASPP